MDKNKPSMTARKVALNIVTLGSQPGMDTVLPHGIVDATAQLLVASGAAGERTVRLARSPRMIAVYEAFDWMLPGQFEAFAFRKAFCEQQVRDSISSGATQILVLGAGYDTLCCRLAPEFSGVRFFEIDHPATSALKQKGVEALGASENLHLIAEDLGERELSDVLRTNANWDVTAQSVILAEGLVMYLPTEAVQSLFRQCAASVGQGSRIAFSYIPSGEDGRPYVGRWTGLMLWLQKVVGEPWLWSIRPEELASFLQQHGWREAPELIKGADRHGVEFFAVAVV
ncbi:MAG: SAM-dependent methyltransferase [Candidatus Electrothrix sp. GW3-4]|uniref:class I SAM-dependent methyltransferase n=1 Tax=Candidatus Electrothrix sp. GW3-4 TaxID=3126740 RepID=UPI0030D14F80